MRLDLEAEVHNGAWQGDAVNCWGEAAGKRDNAI